MPITEHEKLGVDLHVRPSSDSFTGVPIKKRRLLFARSPSPPPPIPSPPLGDCNIPKKESFYSVPEAPFSEAGCLPAQVTAVTCKSGCYESRGDQIIGDLRIDAQQEIFPQSSQQETRADKGTSNVKEMILDNERALQPAGSTQLQSAAKEPSEVPIKEEHVEGYVPTEGITVKLDRLEPQNLLSKSTNAYPKVDSVSDLCLNRSNWDLNTTMDTWDNSLSDSAIDHGTGGPVRLELGGIHKKIIGTGPMEISNREPKKTDKTLGKFKMPNSSTPVDEHYTAEACLDLHLKPMSTPCSMSGKLADMKAMPLLSLSMKPWPTNLVPLFAAGGAVKPEPIDGSQNDTRKVEMDALKPLGLKNVKSEPSEGRESSKTTVSVDIKSACCKTVKQEPLEDLSQSQGYLRSLEGRSLGMELKNHRLPSERIETHQDASKQGNSVSDPASISLTETPNINIPNPGGMMGEVLNLATRPQIPAGSKTYCGSEIRISTAPQSVKGNVSEPSGLVPECLDSGGQLNSVKETSEIAGLDLQSLSAFLGSDGKGCMAEDVMTGTVGQLSSSDGCNLSKVTPLDGSLESNNKVDAAAEVLEECRSDGSHVATEAINTLRKQCGTEDDFEDGEVRDPALISADEHEEKEQNPVKAADPVHPVDVPIARTSHEDVTENKSENIEEVKSHGTVETDNMNQPASPAVGLLATDSSKKKLSKIIRKTPRDLPKKDKGSETKLKSDGDLNAKTVISDSQGDINQQECAGLSDALLAKASGSSKTESDGKDSAMKDAKGEDNRRRIVYLNSATNKTASEKKKFSLGRSISSRIERQRSIGNSFRRDRSLSRGSREENCSERYRNTEIERTQGHPLGKRRSDLMRTRGRADNLHEQINNSTGVRFPHHINPSEVAIAGTSDGSRVNAGRLGRKLTNDELQNLSRLQSRKRSPGSRGQMPMVRHPMRDMSPGRCNVRGVPEFVLLGHEENLMRSLPDGMIDPRSQYGREREGVLVRRGRRSMSPIQRRGPLHLPHDCSKSSPRTQRHSPHQWSPPRRSPPEGFRGTPPMIRLDRMRSPHQRPCFPEDMMVRRRASPPYIARLPNDVVDDIGPPREHDFQRTTRGPQRNTRRFDLIDTRDMREEFFESPHLLHDQIHEFAVDDEYVDDRRRCEEVRGPARTFRQRGIACDDDDDGFRCNVEDGPPRPFRFCPEGNEGFPEGGSPREFDGRFRNRLGNQPGRMRGIEEQEDNYRHHGEQGWRDASFSDFRLKRRRF